MGFENRISNSKFEFRKFDPVVIAKISSASQAPCLPRRQEGPWVAVLRPKIGYPGGRHPPGWLLGRPNLEVRPPQGGA